MSDRDLDCERSLAYKFQEIMEDGLSADLHGDILGIGPVSFKLAALAKTEEKGQEVDRDGDAYRDFLAWKASSANGSAA